MEDGCSVYGLLGKMRANIFIGGVRFMILRPEGVGGYKHLAMPPNYGPSKF